ncbi:MAG: DUF1801 domain-containing protein [Saprospiraceae bacterium]
MANPIIDEYIAQLEKWKEEVTLLRAIALELNLEEEVKWKHPCYSHDKKNIVIIGTFKEYCTLNFFKGALIKDDSNLLIKPGENTQAARIIKFYNIQDIKNSENKIKGFIKQAIEIEKSGGKIEFKKTSEYEMPDELIAEFDRDPDFKIAFDNLTEGKKRAYLLNLSQAKLSQTKEERIIKHKKRIMLGLGVHDCYCGKSKIMPLCDGAHKIMN